MRVASQDGTVVLPAPIGPPCYRFLCDRIQRKRQQVWEPDGKANCLKMEVSGVAVREGFEVWSTGPYS